jgi:hypothetical protein
MGKIPNPLNFPKVFNPFALDLWFAACATVDPKSKGAWNMVLRDFRHRCAKADLDPHFQGDWDSAIQHFLAVRRRHFVRYADMTKLVQGVKVIRSVSRTVDFTDFGFQLTVSAQCHIEDPTWVKKLFRFTSNLRFSPIRDRQRRYVHRIDPGLEVFVYNEMISSTNVWHIGYTISCPLMPDTKGQDRKNFVLNTLWAPIRSRMKPKKADTSRYL